MQKSSLLIVLLIGGFIVLTGCQRQPDAPLPTLRATAAPPTNTVAPQAAASATLAPTATVDLSQKATLPPTWTASPEPTETAVLITDTPPPPAVLPTLAVCTDFKVDYEKFKPDFKLGKSVDVFWTAVDKAISYRIALLDDTSKEIFSGLTKETKFTFQADLFNRGKAYSWNVYPISPIGDQMCTPRGAALIPQ